MAADGISRESAVDRLRDRILDARARHLSLDIRGGNTKAFYAEAPRGEPLGLAELTGISSYEPSELVVTVRAGTPLAELESVLAEQGQCLAFEPPRFAAGGTVGGMVAAGLSGPARAAAGPLRDYVLGVTILNGRGELLSFGGQVMKNVAGYDVSRLMAGSWGILGVLCEVSLKVLATKAATATLSFDWDERQALSEMARWNALPLPLSASAWHAGSLRIRLVGERARSSPSVFSAERRGSRVRRVPVANLGAARDPGAPADRLHRLGGRRALVAHARAAARGPCCRGNGPWPRHAGPRNR
jgi:FAD/FMN-containing dehydrogenase